MMLCEVSNIYTKCIERYILFKQCAVFSSFFFPTAMLIKAFESYRQDNSFLCWHNLFLFL